MTSILSESPRWRRCGRWCLLLALLSQPWLDVRSSAQITGPRGFGELRSVEQDLARELTESLAAARDARNDLQSNNLSPSKRRVLEGRIDRIRAGDLLIRTRQASLQQAVDNGVGGLAPGRMAAAAARYRESFAALGAALDETTLALGAADDGRLRAALDALLGELESRVTATDRTPLGVTLPFRPLGLAPIEPATRPAVVPAYADSRFREPATEDLRESPDAPLDPAILAQARALGQNPIAVFEFVQNDVDIEFYQGAMKGAVETLRGKRGNDVDQASLLVSLMRASGVPARYVRGVIALTTTQALAWTGVSSAPRAADVFAAAGMPFRAVLQGGSIASFEIEHTWVEAAVAYRNYRGAPLTPGTRTWIPLDPSFKSFTYAAGTDVLNEAGFQASSLVTEYLSGLQMLSPLDFFKKRLTDYLSQSATVGYEQAVGRRTLQRGALGLLPSTLPFRVAAVHEERPSIPESLRHHVRFIARTGEGTAFDVTLPASEVVGSRVTLSYVPDTVDDQATIDAFLGLDNTPAYLVRLRPMLKVGGVIRAAGEQSVQMGDLHEFAIEVQSPRSTVPVQNSVMAGGYYALAFGGLHTPKASPATTPAPDDTEEGAAQALYEIAADYLERWSLAEREIADILRLALVRPIVSEVMVGTVHRRTVLFGQPQDVVLRGVFVDADLRISEVVPAVTDAHQPRKVDFRQLAALAGSMAESEVLEGHLNLDSVSAAKVIQIARASGRPVEEVDEANAPTVLPALVTADVVKTDISDGVRQGWHATVPRSDMTYKTWSGIGYVLTDPADGAAGYFISGGLAGGQTADDWELEQASQPCTVCLLYSPPPNTDASSGASIVIVPVTDGQHGTVGEPLAAELAAWVRDKAGIPVQGAQVTFTVALGGGDFGGNAVTVATTSALGLAKASLTLGKKTVEAPFYVLENPTDKRVTRVGQNLVSAQVATANGPVTMSRVFQAYGHPGPAARIVKVIGDGARSIAGIKGTTMQARVEDQFQNPVSNEQVVFTVLPAVANSGALPENARNLQVTPLEPACANPTPVLGECGGIDNLVVLSSVFGAAVDPILGDTDDTVFKVSASVIDESTVEPQIFTQSSLGSRTYGGGQFQPPTLIMTARELINDKGELINATKVGTTLAQPLETVLYLAEDLYRFERIATPPACGPAAPFPTCYKVTSLETRRIRPVNNAKPGFVHFPDATPEGKTVGADIQVASVAFTPTAGFGTTTDPAVKNVSDGRYSTRLTVGPIPFRNQIRASASATVWVPYFDLYRGVIPVLATLQPGQVVADFNIFDQDQSGLGPAPIVHGSPYTLTHEVFGVRATLVLPDRFPIDEEGVLTKDVPVPYVVEPSDYHTVQTDLDILEVDPAAVLDADGCRCKWSGLIVGSSKQGTGTATFSRGSEFDRKKSYRLQMTLNRGGAAAVASDKQNLVFLSGFATYSYYPASPTLGINYPRVDNKKPVRGARVELVDVLGNIVRGEDTNEKGFYAFVPPPTAGPLRLRISATLGGATPHVMVVDNTDPNPATRLYAPECPVAWQPTLSSAVDVHMDSGWNSSVPGYQLPPPICPGGSVILRAAAPFAILDTIYQGEKALKQLDPTIVFPMLTANWSFRNIDTPQDDALSFDENMTQGTIGTTFYTGGDRVALYILGAEDVDTDEYDSHVVLHEWGHYIQDRFSRSDSPGDGHGPNEIVDPRLAFSEGFGNAFSGMLFDPPDPVYVDTKGLVQLNTNVVDVSQDATSDTDVVANRNGAVCTVATPPAACTWLTDGYYSEGSAQEVLWSVFKTIGFKPFYQAVLDMKTREAYATVFSFLQRAKQVVQSAPDGPAKIAAIDSIAQNENIQLADEFGDPWSRLYTLVTHLDAGVDEALRQVGIKTLNAANGRTLRTRDRFWDRPNQPSAPFNKLYDRALFKFTVTQPGFYTIEVKPTVGKRSLDNGDLWFRLRFHEVEFPRVDGGGAGKTETYTFLAGVGTYVFEVGSFEKASAFEVRIHQ